jgi:hypothetical protein
MYVLVMEMNGMNTMFQINFMVLMVYSKDVFFLVLHSSISTSAYNWLNVLPFGFFGRNLAM